MYFLIVMDPQSTPTLHSNCMCSAKLIFKFRMVCYAKMIYGGFQQASKQANKHTHVHNTVPLVWDSLRLAPCKEEQVCVQETRRLAFKTS